MYAQQDLKAQKSGERTNKQPTQQHSSSNSSSFIIQPNRGNPYNALKKYSNGPSSRNFNRSGNYQRYNQHANSHHNNGFRNPRRPPRNNSRNFHHQQQQLEDQFPHSHDKNQSRIPISNIRLADLELSTTNK
ncbi:unnamed protein product, partial [Allacma fusca]